MQEIILMVKDLRKLLTDQETSLRDNGTDMNSYVYGAVSNAKARIDLFEYHASQINVSEVEKSMVIANFQKGAHEIEEIIKNIGLTN